ncbi:hypothetical protein L0128_22560, partial [candidate division KSB1 bacterium]|nr:hypothetical protein [candidate division KSB1 bacterium]
GVSYEKGLHLQGQLVSDPAFIQAVDSTQIPIPEITLRFRLPDVLAFGVTTKSSTNLAFSATLAAVFWHAVDRHYQDQLDLSVSSIYSWSPKLSLAVSFYKTDRDFFNYYEYGRINQSTTYMGLGVKTQGRNFTGRVEILDSHLFSGQYRKQTLVKCGVDYTFQHRMKGLQKEEATE